MSDKERAIMCVKAGMERHDVTPQRQIALGILEDVLDRRGVKHEFEKIDPDVIQEILADWEEIARVVIQEGVL